MRLAAMVSRMVTVAGRPSGTQATKTDIAKFNVSETLL
jgi:hypothetical protein